VTYTLYRETLAHDARQTIARRFAMCPVLPAELVQNAVQQMVYFVTLVGILLGVALGGRA
jgi:hypothetical protein